MGLFGSAHILESTGSFLHQHSWITKHKRTTNVNKSLLYSAKGAEHISLPVSHLPRLQTDGFIAKLASFPLNCSGSFLIWSSFSSLWMKQCFCWFSTSPSPGHRLRKSGLRGGAAMFCFWPLVVRGGSASPLLSEIRGMEKAGSLGGFLLRIRFAVDGLLSSTELTLSASLGEV